MAESISDIERQMLEIAAAEGRIEQLRVRIDLLKTAGQETQTYDSLLEAMISNLVPRNERLSRLATASISYRCYLMRGPHMPAMRILECADDAEAVAKVAELLDALPEHDCAEIWNGGRIVARIPRKARRR